jgi:glycosyltransferase involved in cell wall biosynthesis
MPPPPRVCYPLSHYISHRQAGLQYIGCLLRLGVTLVDTPAEADVVIIHNEPWSVAGYYRMWPELHDRRVIVYAVWETDRLPEHYRFNLSLAGELWTCSDYCARALSQAGPPVSVIPHVVRIPERDPDAEQRMRERLGARDGEFLFYTILNANIRKGLPDVIRAFTDLFPNGEARLVVKTTTPLPPALAATTGVINIAGLLPESDLYALPHVADCLVSAHHSEGWGLTISDAMACGNLVVATAHGGNMDYMNAGNSLPVACTFETIRDDDIKQQPELLSADMHWAYIDPDDLRRQMRRAFDERESLRELGAQAERDMARFAPEQVTAILEERLLYRTAR